MLVSILSDIEALSFGDVAEFYGGADGDAVQIPDESLGLYPEEEDDEEM